MKKGKRKHGGGWQVKACQTKKSTFDFAEINPLYRLRHAVGVAKVGDRRAPLPLGEFQFLVSTTTINSLNDSKDKHVLKETALGDWRHQDELGEHDVVPG